MFGFKYIKFDSMTYVMHYKNGKIAKEGKGLSFFYFAPNSSITAIPMGSNDFRFIFHESTKDYQSVTVQGQITYKVDDPKQLAALLDFTVDAKGQYLKDEGEKLQQRLINEAQTTSSAYCSNLGLKDAIRGAKELEKRITEWMAQSNVVKMLGIEIIGVNILEVKPNPEMARALEAQTREALQQEADQATYQRRNFAVEQERKIKESELNTEIAVEEKKMQIAEKQFQAKQAKQEGEQLLRTKRIASDIELEQQRQQLVDLQTANKRKEADAQGYVLQTTLQPYKELDWKTLMAISQEGNSPALNISLAFREMAENADKIGTLNITPDLLNQLIDNN